MLSTNEALTAAEAVDVPSAMATLSVYRVLLRHPPLAQALTGLLQVLFFRGKLDARLRELIIMRIGWATASEYEWTQHWNVSMRLGLDPDDVVAVRDWESSDRFGDAERAVLQATDETLRDGAISDATWRACEQHVGGHEELLELVAAIGNWRLFSSLLRSLEIPLEEGVKPWPPDGQGP